MELLPILFHPKHANIVTVLVEKNEYCTDEILAEEGKAVVNYLISYQYIPEDPTVLYACVKHATLSTKVITYSSVDDEKSIRRLGLKRNKYVKECILDHNTEDCLMITRTPEKITGTMRGPMNFKRYSNYF